MPFTPSHAAAVLPLSRTRLPLSALVVGSMAPDTPLFIGTPDYHLCHSPIGLLTTDLAYGLLGWLLWRHVLRAPTLRCLPRAIRDRWPTYRAAAPGWVLLALLLGAATHVAWDHCTHHYGWVVHHSALLRGRTWFGRPGYSVAQALSSVVGALLVVAWFKRRPARPGLVRPPPLASDLQLGLGWAALAALALLAGALSARAGASWAYRAIPRAGLVFLLGWTTLAVLMHVVVLPRRTPCRGSGSRS